MTGEELIRDVPDRRARSMQGFAALDHRRHGRDRPISGDHPGTVSLTFPARFTAVRLARLVASGVGAEAGLDVVAIDDLRLVVDEACAVLLECSVVAPGANGDVEEADAALNVAFTWGGDEIRIQVDRRGAITSDVPSAVSVAVLDAITGSWELHRPEARVVVVVPVGDRR